MPIEAAQCANDNYVPLPMKLLSEAEAEVDVFSCYMYDLYTPPNSWGLRIKQRFLNLEHCDHPEILSLEGIVKYMNMGETVDHPSLQKVAYSFDLRSSHIGDNVALWLLQEARAIYGDILTVEERNFIEVLIWKLERNGASTDNICFGSVVEIMRYETCMTSAFESLSTGKHIPHRNLLATRNAVRGSLIGRTSLGELATVADAVFRIAGDNEDNHDVMVKLSNGEISPKVYYGIDLSQTFLEDGNAHHVGDLWKEYVQLAARYATPL
jgi:hypothetical protein